VFKNRVWKFLILFWGFQVQKNGVKRRDTKNVLFLRKILNSKFFFLCIFHYFFLNFPHNTNLPHNTIFQQNSAIQIIFNEREQEAQLAVDTVITKFLRAKDGQLQMASIHRVLFLFIITVKSRHPMCFLLNPTTSAISNYAELTKMRIFTNSGPLLRNPNVICNETRCDCTHFCDSHVFFRFSAVSALTNYSPSTLSPPILTAASGSNVQLANSF
jgi:hypothetical protein